MVQQSDQWWLISEAYREMSSKDDSTMTTQRTKSTTSRIAKPNDHERKTHLSKHNSRNKNGAIKDNASKPRMSLLPRLAKVAAALVMTYGEDKYTSNNWMDGMNWTYLVDAAERHIDKFMAGEDLDPESGFHHIAHAITSLMMLYDIIHLHPEKDDRWKGWSSHKDAQKRIHDQYKRSDYIKDLLEYEANDEVE